MFLFKAFRTQSSCFYIPKISDRIIVLRLEDIMHAGLFAGRGNIFFEIDNIRVPCYDIP